MFLGFDEDDLFVGTPRSKFIDILFNANRNLVSEEVDLIVEKMACMEMMLEKNIDSEELLKILQQFKFDNEELVESKKNSLYIEFMGNIVTRNE